MLPLMYNSTLHKHTCSFYITSVFLSELYTILLEDILVLLQKQDERLVLRLHGKSLVSATDTKNTFSPVIKLSTVLVRPVATGESYTNTIKFSFCIEPSTIFPVYIYIFNVSSPLFAFLSSSDNKSFFVLSMSENGAQIYELTAQTVSEQRT